MVAHPLLLVRLNAQQVNLRPKAQLFDVLRDEPLALFQVHFYAGGTFLCTGQTDFSGTASCNVTLNATVLPLVRQGYAAVFLGERLWDYSDAAGKKLVIGTVSVPQ